MDRDRTRTVKLLGTVIATLAAGLLFTNTTIISAPSSPSATSAQQTTGSPLAAPGVAQAPPVEIVVRMKNDQGPFPWKDLALIVLTATTVAVGVISLILTYRSNRRTLLQKAYEDEMKDIQTKLNSFYGPFRQLLATSKRLYDEFQSHQPDPANFRTLTALLEGTEFIGNDKILLEQILEITQELDKLILSKSELIDEGLQPALWEASTHFRLIRLAKNHSLAGEPQRFQKFVYPRPLNEAIDAEIGRLRNRLEELRRLIAL